VVFFVSDRTRTLGFLSFRHNRETYLSPKIGTVDEVVSSTVIGEMKMSSNETPKTKTYTIKAGTPLVTYGEDHENEQMFPVHGYFSSSEDIVLNESWFNGKTTCSNPKCGCELYAFEHPSIRRFTVSPEDVTVEEKEAA